MEHLLGIDGSRAVQPGNVPPARRFRAKDYIRAVVRAEVACTTRGLRLFLLSLLTRTLLSPFGKPLIIFRYLKHHLLGCGVTHLPCQSTRLFGSFAPMFGVIENVRRH